MIPKLLFDICDCKNFNNLIINHTPSLINTNPCFDIINFQRLHGATQINHFQIPEPWSGNILTAPILFISSNPGFSHAELYPHKNWPKGIIADFFMNRFANRGKYSWVVNDKILLKNGSRSAPVRYWSSIRRRAQELLGRPAVPGIDYCNTELVHCKSSNQIGVMRALPYCTKGFSLLNISGARIIVGVGSIVRDYFNGISSVSCTPIIYIPHPNARIKKTFTNIYTEDELNKIRDILSRAEKPSKIIDLSSVNLPSQKEVEKFIESQLSNN